MRSHKKHKARGRNLPSCRIRTNQPGSKTPPRTTFLFSISFKYWQFVVCRLLFSLQNTLFPHNTTITFRDALDLHAENHSIMLGMTNMCQTKISAESNRYIQPSGQQAKMIKIPFQSASNFGKEATHNTAQYNSYNFAFRIRTETEVVIQEQASGGITLLSSSTICCFAAVFSTHAASTLVFFLWCGDERMNDDDDDDGVSVPQSN